MSINKRTAALVLIEDLQVLHCKYLDKNRRSRMTYTFVTRESWMPEDGLAKGTYLVAQNQTLDRLAVIEFDHYGDITDLELDNESLVYKFALSVLPAEITLRMEEAEATVESVLRAVKRSQVKSIRETVRQALFGTVATDFLAAPQDSQHPEGFPFFKDQEEEEDEPYHGDEVGFDEDTNLDWHNR